MRKNITSAQILSLLAENGFRIFSTQDVCTLLEYENINFSGVGKKLHLLVKNKQIERIKKDTYVLSPIFLNNIPIHEYEIAMHLVNNAAICCFSAFNYHGFTDQIPQYVYVASKTSSTIPRSGNRAFKGVHYKFLWFKETYFFGHSKVWIGDVLIIITDKERTLIDGLIKPQYCGGFMEVLF